MSMCTSYILTIFTSVHHSLLQTQTEMGNGSATKHGMKEAPVKLEDSISGMLSVFDSATRETHGGRFWSEKGELLPF